MLAYDNWGGLIEEKHLIGDMTLVPSSVNKTLPCLQTFTMTVLYDGRVRACGCRFNNDEDNDPLIIGDLKSDRLSDIWNGQKVRDLRRTFGTNRLPSICQKCTAYSPKIR